MLTLQVPKYIYNEPINGIDYNYDLINKEFVKMEKSCHAPKGLFMPCNTPIDKYKWLTFLSERSSSKTTQWLLYGMTMNSLYRTKIIYVRNDKDQTTQPFIEGLFEYIVLKEYGYIEYLTNGRYNSIHIDRVKKQVFYCKRDDSGLCEEICPESFMDVLNIQESNRYTSGYNAPTGDLIIFDEFSRGHYSDNSWIALNNLIATIRRERLSVKIVMLSNTVSIYHGYLQELGISKDLATMKKGDRRVVTALLGAQVYVEWIDVLMHKTKKFLKGALEYHGFADERLKSIYGGDWEYKSFPRIPKDVEHYIISRNVYLEYLGRLVVVEVMGGDLPCINLRPYLKTEPHEDATVFTDDEMRCYKRNYIKANRTNLKWLTYAHMNGKVFFGSNEVGIMFESFVKNLQYTL